MCNLCDTCILIDNPCFCKYSGINGVLLEDVGSHIVEANLELADCIGDDCFDKLCDTDQESEEMRLAVKANLHFKILYTLLIKRDWLIEDGDGQAHKRGVIKVNGDNVSDFEVLDSKAIERRVKRVDQKIESHKKKFLEWFFEKYPECIECNKTTSCGCGCQNIKNNSSIGTCLNTNSCTCNLCGSKNAIGDWVAL